VARPFLIPALVDSESEIRRLTVRSALLKAKYSSLRQKLIDAQIKAQSTLNGVPQLRSYKLGDPLHITKPTKIRPARVAASSFPDILVIKHFYPRHLIIQAKITNSATGVDGRALSNVDFIVAESSDEAIQPVTRIPIKVLPFQSTGCSWCVLTANPQRMEAIAMLTCELRYNVSALEPPGIGLTFDVNTGRSYVEELQDLEVNASYFK
jgi:Vam6/Vps39-like protein vacuolar protein sorting-associated protein 39